ncbi:MAG: cytochrome P450 [Candidatus Obscuribacterales bacterium]|nr:cytochrome P450 [Candidatus Obscuribacterales bacterium]
MTTSKNTSPACTADFERPPGEFFFGNARFVNQTPLTYSLSVRERFGDWIEFSAFFAPVTVRWYQLTHPCAVEHVLQKHQNRYRKPDLFNDSVGLMTGNGILTSEGEQWMHNRRLAQPAFHRQHISTLADLMVGCCDELLQKWQKLDDGSVIDLHKELVGLTFNIAGQALFGADLGHDGTGFGDALRDAFEFINYKMTNYPMTPPLWLPLKRNQHFKEAKNQLDTVVLKIIEQRRHNNFSQNDFLGLLLNARDEVSGEGMNDQQLKDEAITLLVAAHDTVAAALSWTFYLLAKNPLEDRNFYDEVSGALAGQSPNLQMMEKTPYAKMVFEEALRLYPPAWGQPRQALVDDEIEGRHLPKGAIISLSQWVTHRHPEFWDKPETFLPERFSQQNSASRPRFAYFPFGGGSRVCIGQHMAMMEGQIALCAIGSRYRFELTEEVTPDPTFTLIPKGGLHVRLRRRA